MYIPRKPLVTGLGLATNAARLVRGVKLPKIFRCCLLLSYWSCKTIVGILSPTGSCPCSLLLSSCSLLIAYGVFNPMECDACCIEGFRSLQHIYTVRLCQLCTYPPNIYICIAVSFASVGIFEWASTPAT